MNKYGKQAMDHWKSAAPQRYSQIENPTQFFFDLGQQVETQVLDLAEQLTAPDQPGEDSSEKAGRINAARNQAAEIVMADLVWIEAEADLEDDELDQPIPADTIYLASLRQMQEQENEELDNLSR